MNRGWIYLALAGLSEIVWAYGLKMSDGFSHPWWSMLTLIIIFISFYLFSYALKTIPMGTAYAVFTGIGTAGTAILGIVFLNEGTNPLKIVSLTILITGIVGLKLIDKSPKAHDK